MSITNPLQRRTSRQFGPGIGPAFILAGALSAALCFAVVMERSIPHEALVPVTVLLIFMFAAGTTLLAWLRPLPRRSFTYWDAAGALTFIGICVAATVEPDQLVQLVAGNESPR